MSSPPLSSQALVAALCRRYALGHAEIDAQHRRLFEIVAQADDGAPARELLDLLYRYASEHFTAEERIADEENVIDEAHIRAHLTLLDQIAALQHSTANINQQVRQFLVTWVTDHIDKHDRDLVRAISVGQRLHQRMDDDRL